MDPSKLHVGSKLVVDGAPQVLGSQDDVLSKLASEQCPNMSKSGGFRRPVVPVNTSPITITVTPEGSEMFAQGSTSPILRSRSAYHHRQPQKYNSSISLTGIHSPKDLKSNDSDMFSAHASHIKFVEFVNIVG